MPLQRRHGTASLQRARDHIEAGELAAAQELLSEQLGTLPTDPRKARPAEAAAVALQTGVLLSLGEPYAARGWAAYGHNAFRRLYGERDSRTLHTLGLLAAVLTRVGAHGRAAQHYQRLIELFSELEGAQADRALAARADLATVEHARGQCATARMRLANTIADHQRVHGASHPIGVRMLARLAGMWRDCGDFDHAHALLAEARGYAAGLGPEIHDLLLAASRAPAGERHVCGSEPLPETPLSPVELTMPVVDEDTHLVPVIEEPLKRSFSTLTYLPSHPELLAWEPEPAAPAPVAPGRQVSPATLALVAAIVGIVAVTVLLVLLITAVRNT
jgi:Tetratricopeptide repeat